MVVVCNKDCLGKHSIIITHAKNHPGRQRLIQSLSDYPLLVLLKVSLSMVVLNSRN